MKVYKAINAVQLALSKVGIAKDKKNLQGSGYMFRGIDDVYNTLSPLLAEHGLCILPRMIARELVERQSRAGGALFYVTVEAEFDFVSAEDGSKHVVRTFGEAMDSGDKATNKAMSAAYKYAAFQAFAIPTMGDNDADSQTHEVTHIAGRPTDGAWEQAEACGWPRVALEPIGKIALEYWSAKDVQGAEEYLSRLGLPSEAKIAVSTMFPAPFRAALKKLHESRKAA